MKIGIVCYPSVGGSGIVATELGHQLALKGHEVHFIAYEIPFRLRLNEPFIHFHEVEINRYDLFQYPDYALTLAVKIAKVAFDEALDVLHVHYAIPHATSAYLAKELLGMKAKVITTLHGTDITLVGRDPAYYEIVKRSIEKSDAVTAVSHHLKQETIETFQTHCPIEVIHNFFVPKKIEHSIRDQFVKPGEFLLVHSSNFRSVKRVEDVFAIFWKLRKELPVKLLFLGTGDGIDGVKKQVLDRGVEGDVFFKGKIKEIDPFIQAADLCLIPSSLESFGLTALEALAYGVPVIGSSIGGLPEVVAHGKCGFLHPVGEIDQMVASAKKLLATPSLYQSFSTYGKERASKHFSVEKILPFYERCYQNFI